MLTDQFTIINKGIFSVILIRIRNRGILSLFSIEWILNSYLAFSCPTFTIMKFHNWITSYSKNRVKKELYKFWKYHIEILNLFNKTIHSFWKLVVFIFTSHSLILHNKNIAILWHSWKLVREHWWYVMKMNQWLVKLFLVKIHIAYVIKY